MKPRLVALLIAGLSVAGTVNSAGMQSLAEVAKKERERRARIAKNAPSPVMGDKELERSRGDSMSVVGSERAPQSDAPSEGPSGGERALSEKEIRDLRSAWSRIWKEQMEQAEKELEIARDDLYQCSSASRYFFVPLAIDCEGVDLRLAAAEARRKEVENNRYRWELLLPSR